MIYRMLRKHTKRRWDPLESIQQSKIVAGSIMCLIYVRIGMILVIVLLVIVAYICMIDPTIKLDGNLKKILKYLRNKDGKE